MRQSKWGVSILLMVWISCSSMAAVDSRYGDVDLTIGAQLRPRVEVSNKSLVPDADANDFTTMRTRLIVEAAIADLGKAVIQFQDVRAFGDTTQLATEGGDQDVHQAYIILEELADTSVDLQVGRQEINLDGQRLVGAVNWTQQGRSFDGISFNHKSDQGAVRVFGMKQAEKSGNAPAEAEGLDDESLWGAWLSWNINEVTTLSGTALWQEDDSDLIQLSRLTYGLRASFIYEGFKARIEGYKQTGDDSPTTEADASMWGARAGYTWDTDRKPSLTLWYDALSGDDNLTDNKTKVFNTLYATNHKFYGFMDYFLNIPIHTGGLGLTDLAIKGSMKVDENISLKADYHVFKFAENAVGGDDSIGEEIDFTVVWQYHERLKFMGGYSNFSADDNFASEDGDWFYIQADLQV